MNRKFECREAQGCARATVPVISVSEHCGGYGLRPLPILQFLPWTNSLSSGSASSFPSHVTSKVARMKRSGIRETCPGLRFTSSRLQHQVRVSP